MSLFGTGMIATKAKSNCWTCKERKVGCDRALPECGNCARSKRKCKGYGLKLAWPDKYDGRRKQKKYQAAPEGSASQYITQDGNFAFLNTTFNDVEQKRLGVQELVRWRDAVEINSPKLVPTGLRMNRIPEGDGMLLGYYDSVVARMITTIDDNTNGFRLELIPMALTSSDASSQSLLQATLALSSFHLGHPEEALKHKVRAIKSLSESFRDDSGNRKTQFAACMMLCVYSVFDASDTSWYLHLQGAKTITQSFPHYEFESRCLRFLAPWFEYHDTFSSYSHPPHVASSTQQMLDVTLPESTPANQMIVGLLGCSTELLRLISCINQLRSFASFPFQTPTGRTVELYHVIRGRLLKLKQEVHIRPGETTGTISHVRITLTAELYRVATLLYLFQIAPPSTVSETELKSLVQEGVAILNQLKICTSPWPLFIVACNISEDQDRIKLLRFIEEGARERKVGNYQIIKSLVQTVWTQKDLAADEKEEKKIDWRDFLEPDTCMPSFI